MCIIYKYVSNIMLSTLRCIKNNITIKQDNPRLQTLIFSDKKNVHNGESHQFLRIMVFSEKAKTRNDIIKSEYQSRLRLLILSSYDIPRFSGVLSIVWKFRHRDIASHRHAYKLTDNQIRLSTVVTKYKI